MRDTTCSYTLLHLCVIQIDVSMISAYLAAAVVAATPRVLLCQRLSFELIQTIILILKQWRRARHAVTIRVEKRR